MTLHNSTLASLEGGIEICYELRSWPSALFI